MDDSLSRTLCLHIPFLLPPSFEIEISMPIQSAAILGAGLLYLGTCHRLMTEMILSQIGRKPLSDRCMDREVYALCAGVALGLVNINYKDKAIGLSDLQLDERLIRLIEGGKTMEAPLSMLSANMNAESSKCSSVLEGENVNIHITAPGALMAIAIIHMQTDNELVARRLEVPSSFYALEHAKPFHILLKILARNLIMWSRISCSTEWLYSQIPPILREIFESPIKDVHMKYEGTLVTEEDVDYSSIALCYINILAGSILALGLRYAGSNNKTALGIVCREIDKLRQLPTTTLKDQNYVSYTDQNKNKVDKYSLDNCLCICAYSISIVEHPFHRLVDHGRQWRRRLLPISPSPKKTPRKRYELRPQPRPQHVSRLPVPRLRRLHLQPVQTRHRRPPLQHLSALSVERGRQQVPSAGNEAFLRAGAANAASPGQGRRDRRKRPSPPPNRISVILCTSTEFGHHGRPCTGRASDTEGDHARHH